MMATSERTVDEGAAVREATDAAAGGTALAQRAADPQLVAPVEAMDDRAIAQAWRTARALAASQFFKDARQAEQAFAKILLGRDLGLSPTEAMSNIVIVEGKPEMSANFHAMRVKQSPDHDYRVVELSNERCVIQFVERDKASGEMREAGVSEFSIDDAKRAKLDTRGRAKDGGGARVEGTSMYEKFPRNMLWSRAMSNGVAWFIPNVMGSLRVYTPGEIAELGDAAGVSAHAPSSATDEYDWTLVEDEGVRERLRAAVGRAVELGVGEPWPAARCEMTFTGRPRQALVGIAEALEQNVAAAVADRERADDAAQAEGAPVDADVVPDIPAETTETSPRTPAETAETDDTRALRLRVEGLRRRLMLAQSDREQEELEAELRMVEAKLRALAGDAPGQESLGES